MRISKVCKFLILTLGLTLLLFPAEANEAEQIISKRIVQARQKVQSLMNRFDQTDDPELLEEAYDVVADINSKRIRPGPDREILTSFVDPGEPGYERARVEQSKLGLEITNKCFEARDYTYDIEDRPVVFTHIPLLGWMMANGFAPGDPVTPEMRKEYEKAVKENERRAAKDRRETALQEIMDYKIETLHEALVDYEGSDPERYFKVIDIAKQVITSEVFKERFEKEVLEVSDWDKDVAEKWVAYNEKSAVVSLRTISQLQDVYFKLQHGRYADSLAKLAERLAKWDGTCWQEDLPSGYRFEITGEGEHFNCTAEPVQPRVSGNKYFYLDETGVIRFETGKPATAESPVYKSQPEEQSSNQ